MRALFLFGVAAGFAGVLATARYFPWVEHPRVPAQTEVITNGGRAEAFVIRLPADRLAASGTADTGLRGEPWPAGRLSLAGAGPWLAEEFKVRDVAGRVIGVAARHWTLTEDGPAAAWCLVIPGRGTLFLAGPGEAPRAVDEALRRAGRGADGDWSGHLRLVIGGDAGGEVIAGSDEFAGLKGRYTEAWSLSGVGAEGELSGTIELDTRTFEGS